MFVAQIAPLITQEVLKVSMKFRRSLAALSIAATSVVGAMVAPAQAANLNPDTVRGQVAPATVHEGATPGLNPAWREKATGDRVVEMWAHSPSMNRDVPLVVLKAANPGRPTIYLLNGGDGGEGSANWVMQTKALDFYRDKDVNVVIPMAGKFSYYTDWVSEAPSLGGKQNWETFLTKELPGPIERHLGASNKRAIAGLSMSATSALVLAEHAQGFYDATGSFSGCAATSSPLTYHFLRLTLERGGATPEQMWGPQGSEVNRYNDALINAERLRGTEVYVSNNSGTVGKYDLPSSPRLAGNNPATIFATNLITSTEGGIIEAGTNMCTHDLKVKMDSLNIPATFNFRNTGTHSWGYWEEDMVASWELFNMAFNK